MTRKTENLNCDRYEENLLDLHIMRKYRIGADIPCVGAHMYDVNALITNVSRGE